MLTQYKKYDKPPASKLDERDIITMLSLLKNLSLFDSITAIVSLFELEIYTHTNQFDKALALFKV